MNHLSSAILEKKETRKLRHLHNLVSAGQNSFGPARSIFGCSLGRQPGSCFLVLCHPLGKADATPISWVGHTGATRSLSCRQQMCCVWFCMKHVLFVALPGQSPAAGPGKMPSSSSHPAGRGFFLATDDQRHEGQS